MANSGTVTAGSAALASQYNNLRDDVLNVSTGHTHTGASENGAKVAATGVSSGTAALGAVLTADGSGAAAFLAAGASGGILKYEEFTSSGSFVIPASASSSAIMVLDVVGAGAGGDSGGRSGAGTAAQGGSGGAGGAKGQFVFLASTLGTAGGTVTVTIGAGGAGGAARTTSGDPNLGSSGGTTSFSSLNFNGAQAHTNYYTATGNVSWDAELYLVDQSFTAAGNASGSALPTGTMKVVNDKVAALKASWGALAENEDFRSAWDSAGICAGGGSGGGHTAAGVFKRGGNGGKFNDYQNQIVANSNGYEPRVKYGNGSSGGTTAGANGSASASGSHDGAGGGAGAVSATGGNGGAGAIGGGGGGGGSSQGGTSGAGAVGGNGRVRVWVIG